MLTPAAWPEATEWHTSISVFHTLARLNELAQSSLALHLTVNDPHVWPNLARATSAIPAAIPSVLWTEPTNQKSIYLVRTGNRRFESLYEQFIFFNRQAFCATKGLHMLQPHDLEHRPQGALSLMATILGR